MVFLSDLSNFCHFTCIMNEENIVGPICRNILAGYLCLENRGQNISTYKMVLCHCNKLSYSNLHQLRTWN